MYKYKKNVTHSFVTRSTKSSTKGAVFPHGSILAAVSINFIDENCYLYTLIMKVNEEKGRNSFTYDSYVK